MNRNAKILLILLVLLICAAASLYAWEMRPGANELIPEKDQYVPGNLLLGIDSSKKLGTHLIGFNGMTLYVSAGDETGVSNCVDACARIWIPYLAPYKDSLSNIEKGIPGKIGTAPRVGNTVQVTYEGRPLYFYSGDSVSGETKGQGLDGQWAIVSIPAYEHP
jgi:predicted lipoprotein with Yx(FWY)xxD motif